MIDVARPWSLRLCPLLQDVVKDILAFADTGAGDESLPEVPHDPHQSRSLSPSSQSSERTDESAYTG